MKKILLSILLTGTLFPVTAQERLPREECLKHAFLLCANLKEMLNTPIATDPDVKRPAAIRHEHYGALVLPETKLSAEAFARAGSEVTPLGQLWLVKLVPLSNGEPVPAGKLRLVQVSDGNREATLPCFALGVSRDSSGSLEMLVYGNSKEPVLRAPLRPISVSQENPIEISSAPGENKGLLRLRFLGRYEGVLTVADPDR